MASPPSYTKNASMGPGDGRVRAGRSRSAARVPGAASTRPGVLLDQLGGIAFKHGDLKLTKPLRQALDIRKAAAPRAPPSPTACTTSGRLRACDLATAEDHFKLGTVRREQRRRVRPPCTTSAAWPRNGATCSALRSITSARSSTGAVPAGEPSPWPPDAQPRKPVPKQGRVAEARDITRVRRVETSRAGSPAVTRRCAWAISRSRRTIRRGGAPLPCCGSGRRSSRAAPPRPIAAWASSSAGASGRPRPSPRISPRSRHSTGIARALGGSDEVGALCRAVRALLPRDARLAHGAGPARGGLPRRGYTRLPRAAGGARPRLLGGCAGSPGPRAAHGARGSSDRAFAALAGAQGTAADDARAVCSKPCAAGRDTFAARLLQASARLAVLQYPEPLDLPRTGRPWTPARCSCSYAIGERKSYLFSVGPAPTNFTRLALDATLPSLRDEVSRFCRPTAARTKPLRALAERRHAARAVTPDRPRRAPARACRAPLHLVPFAARPTPTSPRQFRYLVEGRPCFTAASATVFAIQKARPKERPARLVAFGDPDYRGGGPAARALVAGLYAHAPSRLTSGGRGPRAPLLGAGARARRPRRHEERARRTGEEPLLFAGHAVADERSPLDSSLVFSLPA